jgi:outer membrane protein
MNKKTLLAILLGFSGLVYANDFKLGYVDVSKIFTTSKPAIAMQNALKSKFDPQQKELQGLNAALLKEQSQMEAIAKKAPSMDKLSVADRNTLERLQFQAQKDQVNFQQKYTTFQQSVQRNQDYASALVLDKVNAILKGISDKGNYDLVLTSNQLVYAKPKYDLTDQLLEQLNLVNSAALVKELDNADKKATATSSLPSLSKDSKSLI